MSSDPKLDAIVLLGGQIDRLEKKAAELREQLRLLIYGSRVTEHDPVEQLIREAEATAAELRHSEDSQPRVRKSRFPEGPPLNKKIMDFLRQANRPCGYLDILEDVQAHHQSILNALRELERRGLVAKLAPNQWVATDTKGGLRVLKQQ